MLEVALHELQQVLEMRAAPVAAYLAPGLPREAADALAARYDLELPTEVADYFGWHDGLKADRDRDIELLPALRPLSLAESLELQAALSDALAILPEPAPVLSGRWLPLFADDAGAFWLVSAEADAAPSVYAFELEDPGAPAVRFVSLTALARALAELFRSGAYAYVDGSVRIADPRAAEAIMTACNGGGGAGASPSDGADANQADGAGPAEDTAAANRLTLTLSALEGSNRARRILNALDELGLATVAAAIDALDIGARDEVARSLGSAESPRAAPVLLHLLADTEDYVRETAAGALGFTREPAVADALLPLLSSQNHNLRKAAAFSLGELRIAAAADPLLVLAGDDNPVVRSAAATAIGKIGRKVEIGPLVQLLEDPYADAAQMAAWALGEIGDPAAAPALERAADSADPTLARIARAALEQLQGSN